MTLAVRLFRNDSRIRFSRPVHETVEQSLLDHPELVRGNANITIQHYGYLKPDRDVESKLDRYPRSQLAYVFQERTQRLWASLLHHASPDHPVQAAARESAELLRRITPPRPYVGDARRRRMSE
jgi:hypothetical protein